MESSDKWYQRDRILQRRVQIPEIALLQIQFPWKKYLILYLEPEPERCLSIIAQNNELHILFPDK